MINDALCNSLLAYIEAQGSDTLLTASVAVRDDDADKTYPLITIEEDGEPEQHELLRNEWTARARITLRTIPEDTPEATHQAINTNLRQILRDVDALADHVTATLVCHDIWGGEGRTEADDPYRTTEFEIEARVRQIS